ncbi:cyclodeaminase/cyclohydrolase family protein [uncultured Microbacterium sp.]|uniref:cyclodeaminase/cyclohydrolase family protein n=1 Tax=uncultured Microbacterium sp. TaxID=191216 RepID=UPI0028D045A1|nr:cyclodeaminase/cyclohydrolase family protein [uncultured Microbacterium sp.]
MTGEATGDGSATKALDAWLRSLAEADGAPGGGAACGVILGVSAALLHMVAGYTEGPRAAQSGDRLVGLRRDALQAADADGACSAALGAALAREKDDAGRDDAVRDAALAAAESSAALGEVAESLVPELELLAEIGNPHITADLVVAAHALVAGVAGAMVNLRGDLRLAAEHSSDAGGGAREEGLEAGARAMTQTREAASRTAAALSARVDAQ